MAKSPIRNHIGYAGNPPHPAWPNAAKIAVSFVLNYEEGGERHILDGDTHSENYLTEINLTSLENARSLTAESLFDYGSRAGCWRLLQLFNDYQIKFTQWTVGLAAVRNPDFIKAVFSHGHEIAGHGYRWIDYANVSKKKERQQIELTLNTLEQLTGTRPVGWYTGRRSQNTRQLLIKAGLRYDSDDYSDDLPYWVHVNEKPHLIIPYTLDCNDAKYYFTPGMSTADDFFNYLKDSFDYLYREGNTHPKLLTIALHNRISGHPGRTIAVLRFLDYLKQQAAVWIPTRQEIASHWLQHFPP